MIDITQYPGSNQSNGDKLWNDSIQTLERELEIYRQAAASEAGEDDISAAARRKRLTTALRSAQSVSTTQGRDGPPIYHPISTYTLVEPVPVPAQPTKRPTFDERSMESSLNSKSHHLLKQTSRGFLMFVTAPLALVGMGIYATGMMMEGAGMMLKGLGAAGRMPLDKARDPPRKRTSGKRASPAITGDRNTMF